MTSEIQIKANQLNSLKSTGPKSEAGKGVVSMNSRKHGILSTRLLLPEENSDEFHALKDSILDQYKPQTPIECILANNLIETAWRLNRASRIENGSHVKYEQETRSEEAMLVIEKEIADFGVNPANTKEIVDGFIKDSKDSPLKDRDEFCKAIETFVSSNNILKETYLNAAKSYVKDSLALDSFSKIARYRRSIENGFYLAMDKLEQAIAKREKKEAREAVARVVEDSRE